MEKSTKLKVCELCAVDFTLKQFLLPLMDRMASEGWEVTAICSDGTLVPELRKSGYSIITTPISRSLNVFQHVVSIFRLYKIFRRQKFDVLHVHTPVAALIGRIAGRLAGVPLIIYTAHGFYFHDEMPNWKRQIFVRLERFGARFGDLIFTVSEEDARSAVMEKISREDQVLAIGNGVSTDRFFPISDEQKKQIRFSLGIPENARVVGSVGRMVAEKGYPELLQAAITISEEFPETYFLLVGGRLDSDHNQSIETELEEARKVLGSRLVTTGFRSDIPELIGAMDIFCLPSHREGMPISVIEAMLMSKPIVATRIRGSREEVVDGETGYLVPTRSAADLAEAISRLLFDSNTILTMGCKGRERALRLYDEKKVLGIQIERIKNESSNLRSK